MKLTLGQAAKEVEISKPSLSAAIKKGRISAFKNDKGAYEIDPAELFRVYPPKKKANEEANSKSLPKANPKKTVSLTSKEDTVSLLLAERDKLLEEKDKAIRRLEDEKSELREDLNEQREQAKRITLLLEDKSGGVGEFQKSLAEMDKRFDDKLAKQEQIIQEAKKEQEEKSTALQNEKRDLEKSISVFKYTFAALILAALVALFMIYGKDFL